MCGIAGVVGDPEINAEVIRRMAASLAHRGPDDEGVFVEFAWELPLGLKVRDDQSKWILRQILCRHIPAR